MDPSVTADLEAPKDPGAFKPLGSVTDNEILGKKVVYLILKQIFIGQLILFYNQLRGYLIVPHIIWAKNGLPTLFTLVGNRFTLDRLRLADKMLICTRVSFVKIIFICAL